MTSATFDVAEEVVRTGLISWYRDRRITSGWNCLVDAETRYRDAVFTLHPHERDRCILTLLEADGGLRER